MERAEDKVSQSEGEGVEGVGEDMRARWGLCQVKKRALVCASPVSTLSLVQRTSNCATPHVISNIYKRTPRLIMISNTSSASLQSRGSAQSSIPYTRYCYSPPPHTAPMPPQQRSLNRA